MTDHKKGLAAAARQAARAGAQLYKARNPDAALLYLRADMAAVRPRPKQMRNAAVRAVRLFLGDRTYLALSNEKLAAHLSADLPGYSAPPNLLTERFSPAEKTEVAGLLAAKGIKLDVGKLNTPSKIKAALRAHHAGVEPEAKATCTVAITPSSVIVNGRAYPISGEGRLQRIQVGKGKLNLATLRELLCP
jgi:hypothetical protein